MLSATTAAPHGSPAPSYIFRGHESAIHALHFFSGNRYFASGDAEGWIVIWRLTTKRPVAVWRAHDGLVMGLKTWCPEPDEQARGIRLLSHARDHKLRVWQIQWADLDVVDVKLPAQRAANEGTQGQPWLLHSMAVNALGFCAFAICPSRKTHDQVDASTSEESDLHQSASEILIAAPNGLDQGGVDIFHLPREQRISKIQSDKQTNTGMIMALRLFWAAQNNTLMLAAGYEDGRVAVYERKDPKTTPVWVWERTATARPHTQPVLSLDVTPDRTAFVTSSADAIVAKFEMSGVQRGEVEASRTVNTKHAGQQDLTVRSDGRVFATAGWDGSVRVYSARTLKELAVLRWHRQGCYAVAFAEVDSGPADGERRQGVESNMLARMRSDRDTKTHNTHWLVAGSKDGKISLWDIY